MNTMNSPLLHPGHPMYETVRELLLKLGEVHYWTKQVEGNYVPGPPHSTRALAVLKETSDEAHRAFMSAIEASGAPKLSIEIQSVVAGHRPWNCNSQYCTARSGDKHHDE